VNGCASFSCCHGLMNEKRNILVLGLFFGELQIANDDRQEVIEVMCNDIDGCGECAGRVK
jgi:hypothetical protein